MEDRTGNIIIEEPEDKFKKVNIGLIMDSGIDCLTLGIYVKILTLGKKWNLNIKGLSSLLDLSDSKIRKSIKLLEEKGYISRHAVKKENGKFEGWNYKLYSNPIEEDNRTNAGKRTYQKSDTPQNGQHLFPTTPISDNTENREDNNNRLNELIDRNNDIEVNNSGDISTMSPEEKTVSDWRNDFNAYLILLNNAKETLLNDEVFYSQIEKYYPNVDYDKTIQKAIDMYWGTEEGWKKKKRGNTTKGYVPDMLMTLKNVFRFSKGYVYKDRGQIGRVRLDTSAIENKESEINKLIIGGTEYK